MYNVKISNMFPYAIIIRCKVGSLVKLLIMNDECLFSVGYFKREAYFNVSTAFCKQVLTGRFFFCKLFLFIHQGLN